MKYQTIIIAILVGLVGCARTQEVDLDTIESVRQSADSIILEKTINKSGPPAFLPGKIGGSYVSTITNDPRTFNTLTARDSDSRAVIDSLFSNLLDYDPYKREFIPEAAASFEIDINKEQDTVTVSFTLRDDLYWTTPTGDVHIQVTADDVVFWYDEIVGDVDLQQPGYAGQFHDMPDGSEKRRTIQKTGRLSFDFVFPRIISNPLLSSNMTFGPRYFYEPIKQSGGITALRDALDISTDVQTIPSMGSMHIVEYAPGKYVKLKRNPHYWKKDEFNVSVPYIETYILRIVADRNASFLLFQQGETDSYSPRPEDLDLLLNKTDPDYDVYNGGASLGSDFITFNQNPNALQEPKLSWFTNTKFRQAMSSVLNRERIAKQVYRGLAEPALYFFARPNPYFDPNILLEYSYNPERAITLLAEMGITKDKDGKMYDSSGNHIEFNIMVNTENNIRSEIISIFIDELKLIGITAHLQALDFQSLVGRLTESYDWDSCIVSLGSNYWPNGGSNVWQSSGNFHLWNPLQEEAATAWEGRIDELYDLGMITIDTEEAKEIYDEYQKIILSELPVMYIVHPFSFLGIRSKWQNVFYDNLGGLDKSRLFLE